MEKFYLNKTNFICPDEFEERISTSAKNDLTAKVTLKSAEGDIKYKSPRYQFLYDSWYRWEEAADENGESFKRSIEKNLPQCECSYDAYPSEGGADWRGSQLELECECKSDINFKTRNETSFQKIRNELDDLVKTMDNVAFRNDRNAY